jgi:hypothetical protein
MGAHPLRHALAAVSLLSGCPTVDLGDTPTEINLCNPPGGVDYFTATIYPMYLRGEDPEGCTKNAGCHNEGGGNALNFRIGARRDDRFNFKQAQQFLNCGTPESSVLLTRPLAGIDAHGGGDIYAMDAAEIQLFLDWFE